MKATEIAAQRIRELRGKMPAEEFGRRMGELGFPMSRQTVWKVEHHGRPLALDELFAAAYVLGTSPLALVDPGPDESFEIGDGVSVGGSEAGTWFVHADHPRDDVDEVRLVASLPPALHGIYMRIQEIDDDREKLAYALDRVTEGFKALPPEESKAIASAMQATWEEDTSEEGS